ncbi:MAG: succinyldiaminopimelate transaminase [Gammaproteobacteria bacterium]|nr:MAG: succinyldiaminopimelate transaminase [Gammaproteobacteria bacterium]
MNPLLQRLHPYPFERLAELKANLRPPSDLSHIPLSIGEPRHPPPGFVGEALCNALSALGTYPVALGLEELRIAIADWLSRRFTLPATMIDPATMILPVNGTREGLFSFVQAVVDPAAAQCVLMPNPFYQIYEGAALLAGAEPVYLPTLEENGYLPDLESVPASTWDRCAVLFLCSPGNPTGAVMDADFLARAIELADQHDFVIASDECYSDIYLDESSAPVGLLEVCRDLGRDDLQGCVVFHSLSKRSSVPGLRSGFVAGDAEIMAGYRLYRTYHGCAVPNAVQLASIPAWQDDAHVQVSRSLYQEKFDAVLPLLDDVLPVARPAAAFYLWVATPVDDERFARELFATRNVTVLPGRYLSRSVDGIDPGENRVRISLVATTDECVEAAERIRDFCKEL